MKAGVLVELEERAGQGEPLTEREQALLDQAQQLLQTMYGRLGRVWRARLSTAGGPGLFTAPVGKIPVPQLKFSAETQRRLKEQERLYKEMRRRMSPSLRRKYKGFAGWSFGNYMRVFGRLYRLSSPTPARLPRNTVGGRGRPGAPRRRRQTRRARAGPGSDPDLPDEPPGSSGVAGPGPASRRARPGAARRVARRGRPPATAPAEAVRARHAVGAAA